MGALRKRGARFLGAFLFAALLLIPLLESGHSHETTDLARPCAVCVIAHHAPAAASTVIQVAAPLTAVAAVVIASVVPETSTPRSPSRGRAPPSSSIAEV